MARRIALFLLFGCAVALAQEKPDLERRVAHLANELRCLVCQNQTLADSNAPLAVDLRNQIREQLASGKTERDVIDFMVARYGDFVLYRPPLKATTIALWAGAVVLLALGVWILRRVTRRGAGGRALSEDGRARAAKLLE